jgi:hypothetical protein
VSVTSFLVSISLCGSADVYYFLLRLYFTVIVKEFKKKENSEYISQITTLSSFSLEDGSPWLKSRLCFVIW